MTIIFTYADGFKQTFENVADFYETENKYIIAFSNTKEVTTIHISQVESYKKIKKC